eukprot:m.336132 g.336132  ORF g.336132 m.336132 type:complete len:431 (+) comp17766_c0_seq1:96-1388(+)
MDSPFVLQVNVAVKNDTKAQVYSHVYQFCTAAVDFEGCFFQHAEIFDGEAEAEGVSNITIEIRCKSRIGLDNYFSKYSQQVAEGFAQFGDSVSVKDKVLSRRGDAVFPTGKAKIASPNADTTVYSRKRAVDLTQFQGLNLKAGSNNAALRYEEPIPRVGVRDTAPGITSAGVTRDQNKAVDTRFHEDKLHKAPPKPIEGAIGLTSKDLADREEFVRFDQDTGRRMLGNPRGPDPEAAGVGTENQLRVVDRYHSDPKVRAAPVADDGVRPAGVNTQSQIREVDRYHSPTRERTVKQPDPDCAGVPTSAQIREVDRYHADRPNYKAPPTPIEGNGVAGVVTNHQIREVDRYHREVVAPKENPNTKSEAIRSMMDYGHKDEAKSEPAATALPGPSAGVGSHQQRHVVDRYDVSVSPSKSKRQPPGGASSFIFG